FGAEVGGQVGSVELGVADAVAGGVFASARDEPCIALYTYHPPGAARNRQREIAETAEQIQHAIVSLRIEQAQRLRDHLLVHAGVDLHEIQRQEVQPHVGRGNREMQRYGIVQRMHRVDALGLQVDAETMRRTESTKTLD